MRSSPARATRRFAGSASSSSSWSYRHRFTRGLGLIRSLLGSRLGTDVNIAILERATRPSSFVTSRTRSFYDQLSRARREASSRPVSLVTESFALVQNVLTLAGYAALFDPLQCVGRSRADGGDCSGDDRRDAVLQDRFPPPQLAFARIAPPHMYLEYVLANDEHSFRPALRCLPVRRYIR